jgi:hypothetical protein
MAYMIDLFLGFGALAAATYCLILSRRLKALARLDGDVGGAIAILSSQVDELTRALHVAHSAATSSASRLDSQTGEANAAVRRLELLLASLHDLPTAPEQAGSRQRAIFTHATSTPSPTVSAVAPRENSYSVGPGVSEAISDRSYARARVVRRRGQMEAAE